MQGLRGVLGYKGEQGLSAYEVAVKEGYEGTEQEWINHFGLDLSGYVQTSDVVDDLTSTYTTRPLSAKQGKTLNDKIDSYLGEFEATDTGFEHTYTLLKDYTQSDIDRVSGIIAQTITPTEEDIELYDFSGDGEIKSNDLLKLEKLIETNCATGLTSPAKLKIETGSLPIDAKVGLYDCDGNLVRDYYTKAEADNKVAVVTGSYSVEKSSNTTISSINYPTGFDKDNCVVVSIGANLPGYSYRYAAFGGGKKDGTEYLGNLIMIAMLGTTITLDITNISDTYDLAGDYKIVLMKVA